MTDETTARRALLAQLFAADRGKKLDDDTASAYLLALRHMDTPRLARVVERILGEAEINPDEPYRVPQPGRIWRVAKDMRRLPAAPAAPPLVLHGAPEQKPDAWDTAANLALLNYVTFGLAQKSIHGQKPTRDANRYAPDARYDGALRCGPMTRAATEILQRWKNGWATDMREDRELYGGKRDGKALWADYMARAEAEIDQLHKQAAA